jgi:hypothetical protein
VSATVSVPKPDGWLRVWLSGNPHQVVSSSTGTYLLRWFVLPHNRFLNIYLHRFVASDDPVPHDHPWPFFSMVLGRGYIEATDASRIRRGRGSVAFREATFSHSVELLRDRSGREIPCWTLVITGPRCRAWGFWCPRALGPAQFIPWQEFDAGGCGEPADTTTHQVFSVNQREEHR